MRNRCGNLCRAPMWRGRNRLLPKALLVDMDDTILAYEQGIDLDSCWVSVCGKYLNGENGPDVGTIVAAIK
ncbi:MAG: hypothetical protein K0Q94_3258, partial [Paenibacillus sp.]|nr:hypothetical protein [Paenibacillus sp.]